MKKKEEKVVATTETQNKLVVCIANAGYSDDIVAQAKALGATGATILNGRGTASGLFMGMNVTPEKEIILVVTTAENATRIMEAIKNFEKIPEESRCVCFCAPVSHLTKLKDKA